MLASRLVTWTVALAAVIAFPAGTSAGMPAPLGFQAGLAGARGYGTVRLRIKVPQPVKPNGAAARPRALPLYISGSTKSFAVLTDGKNPVVANVDPTTLDVSFFLRRSVGTHTFTVTAYDRPGARGNVLSTGTTAPIFVPPTGTHVYLTLDGVVASVELALAHPTATIGSQAIIDLDVLAKDADGNTIVGYGTFSAPFTHPITLTSSDPANGTLSQTVLTQSVNEQSQYFQRVSVTYSGAGVAKITFSASGIGLKSVTPAVLVPLAAPASGEQILVTGSTDLNAAFSTATGQFLATFGAPPQAVNTYAAAAVDDVTHLVYIADYGDINGGGIDIYQTNGARVLVDSFNPVLSFEGLAVDSPGKRLFATDLSTNVLIFSTATGHPLLGKIPYGDIAAGVAVDPVAQRLYVASCGFESTYAGCPGLQVFSMVPPYNELYKSPGGRYTSAAIDLVAGRLYLAEPPNFIDVYDTSDLNTLVARVAVAPLGEFPNGIAIDVKGRRLYVQGPSLPAFPFANTVQAYGLDTGLSFLGSFPTIPNSQFIAVAPYGP